MQQQTQYIPYSSDDAVDYEKDQMIFPSSSRLLGGSPDDDESDGEDMKVPSDGAVNIDATTKTTNVSISKADTKHGSTSQPLMVAKGSYSKDEKASSDRTTHLNVGLKLQRTSESKADTKHGSTPQSPQLAKDSTAVQNLPNIRKTSHHNEKINSKDEKKCPCDPLWRARLLTATKQSLQEITPVDRKTPLIEDKERIPSTTALVTALNDPNRTDRPALWLMFKKYNVHFAKLHFSECEEEHINQYCELARVQPIDEKTRKLLKTYVEIWREKLEVNFDMEMYSQGIKIMLQNLHPESFNGNPLLLLKLGSSLIEDLPDDKLWYTEGTYDSHKDMLYSLHYTLLKIRRVCEDEKTKEKSEDDKWQPDGHDSLYKRFKAKLAIIEKSKYYPFRYLARLTQQSLAFFRAKPETRSRLWSFFYGVKGGFQLAKFFLIIVLGIPTFGASFLFDSNDLENGLKNLAVLKTGDPSIKDESVEDALSTIRQLKLSDWYKTVLELQICASKCCHNDASDDDFKLFRTKFENSFMTFSGNKSERKCLHFSLARLLNVIGVIGHPVVSNYCVKFCHDVLKDNNRNNPWKQEAVVFEELLNCLDTIASQNRNQDTRKRASNVLQWLCSSLPANESKARRILPWKSEPSWITSARNHFARDIRNKKKNQITQHATSSKIRYNERIHSIVTEMIKEKTKERWMEAAIHCQAIKKSQKLKKQLKELKKKQEELYGSDEYVEMKPFLHGDKPWSIATSFIQLAIIKKEVKRGGEQEANTANKNQTRDELLESYESIYAEKQNISFYDLPGIFQKTRKVVLLGRAGIGKTTVCKKLAHLWAKGEWGRHFEAVYVLSIRVLNTYIGEADLEHAIARFCFKDGKTLDEERVRKRDKLIEHQLKERGDKVLLILDGLDEANDSTKKLLNQASNEEKYGKSSQLWVSRPYGVEANHKKGATVIKNVGFSSGQVERYVRTYFELEEGKEVSVRDDSKNASNAAHSLIAYLKDRPDVKGIAHVPINLQILCNLWKSGKDKVEAASGSMTILYDLMVKKVWERYEKHEDGGRYVRVDGEKVIIRDDKKKLMKLLGCIALASFQEAERQILIDEQISEAEINKAVETNKMYSEHNHKGGKRALRELLAQSGFLRKTDDGSKSEFLHLTFQERFAGTELALQLLSKDDNEKAEAAKYISANKYKSELKIVFSFLAGKVYLKGSEEGLQRLLRALDMAPQEEMGLQHNLLKVFCIEQCLEVGMIEEELKSIADYSALVTELTSSAIEDLRVASLRRSDPMLPRLLANLPCWMKTTGLARVYTVDFEARHDINRRIKSIVELGRSATAEAQSGLVKALRDKDKNVRYEAVKAIGYLGSSAIPEAQLGLVKALRDEDRIVRKTAASAIGKLGSSFTAEAQLGLVKALRDKDIYVYYEAVKAIGYLGSSAIPEAQSGLVKALRDEDKYVRWFAASAIEDLGSSATAEAQLGLVKALRDEDKDVRQAAASAIGKLRSSAIPEAQSGLVKALKDEDGTVRWFAASAIEDLGSSATAQAQSGLLKALRDEDKYVRQEAASAIGYLGSSATAEAQSGLVETLEDEDRTVRYEAASAIGKLSSSATAQAQSGLVEALRNEDIFVRWAAKHAIKRLGSSATAKAQLGLVKALRDEDKDVRLRAAYAIGKLGSSATAEVQSGLVNALRDEDEDVRQEVAYAMGLIANAVRAKAAESTFVDVLLDGLLLTAPNAEIVREVFLNTNSIFRILAYCKSKQKLIREVLSPMIINDILYHERLVITEQKQVFLYQQVGSTPLNGLPREGIEELQMEIKAYRNCAFESYKAYKSGTSAGMTTGEGNKDVKEDHDVKDNEDAVKEKDAEADERKCLNNW